MVELGCSLARPESVLSEVIESFFTAGERANVAFREHLHGLINQTLQTADADHGRAFYVRSIGGNSGLECLDRFLIEAGTCHVVQRPNRVGRLQGNDTVALFSHSFHHLRVGTGVIDGQHALSLVDDEAHPVRGLVDVDRL